jgi:hypothetical protein
VRESTTRSKSWISPRNWNSWTIRERERESERSGKKRAFWIEVEDRHWRADNQRQHTTIRSKPSVLGDTPQFRTKISERHSRNETLTEDHRAGFMKARPKVEFYDCGVRISPEPRLLWYLCMRPPRLWWLLTKQEVPNKPLHLLRQWDDEEAAIGAPIQVSSRS